MSICHLSQLFEFSQKSFDSHLWLLWLTSWLRRSWVSGLVATSATFICPSASDTLLNEGMNKIHHVYHGSELNLITVRKRLTDKVWVGTFAPGQLFRLEVHPSAQRFFLQEHCSGSPCSERSCSLLHRQSLSHRPALLSLCPGCLWPTACPVNQRCNKLMITTRCSRVFCQLMLLVRAFTCSLCDRSGEGRTKASNYQGLYHKIICR